MFNDDIETVVSFMCKNDVEISISQVDGNGLVLGVKDQRDDNEIDAVLSPEDVEKLFKIITEARKYVTEHM